MGWVVPSHLLILACTRGWFWPCSWCTSCWLASWRIVLWRALHFFPQKIENLWARVEYSTFESTVEWSCWCSWQCCGSVTVSAFSRGPLRGNTIALKVRVEVWICFALGCFSPDWLRPYPHNYCLFSTPRPNYHSNPNFNSSPPDFPGLHTPPPQQSHPPHCTHHPNFAPLQCTRHHYSTSFRFWAVKYFPPETHRCWWSFLTSWKTLSQRRCGTAN